MMVDHLRYFGPVDPDSSWALFHAALERVGRYEARDRLTMFDAVKDAIAAAFAGKDAAGEQAAARTQLTEAAYPIRFERQVILNGRNGRGTADA